MNLSKTEMSEPTQWPSEHRYLIAWNKNGIQIVYDLALAEQMYLLNVLADKYDPDQGYSYSNPIMSLIVTAFTQPEMKYEIYYFDSCLKTGDITVQLDNDVEQMKNTIRQDGINLIQERYNSKKEQQC